MILSQWSLIFLAGKLILSSLGSPWTAVKYIQILTHFSTLHIRAFRNQGFIERRILILLPKIEDCGWQYHSRMPTTHIVYHEKYLVIPLRKGFNKKTKENMDLSIFGWVGGSGWGQYPYKKQKKNMPLKSILDHSKSF